MNFNNNNRQINRGYNNRNSHQNNQLNNPSNNQQNNEPRVRVAQGELCDFCQVAGHDIANCQAKIRWDLKTQEQSGND